MDSDAEVIAVDTNLLVYAHRSGVLEHRSARRAIERAASDPRGFGISIFSLAEFWCVVTHPAAEGRPSTPKEAMRFMRALVDDAGLLIWAPGVGFADRFFQLASDLGVTGTRVFDLQIALTAFDNGAHEIWTHDAQFKAFAGLRVVDPLKGPLAAH